MSDYSILAQLYELFAAVLVLMHLLGPALGIAAPPVPIFGAAIVFSVWAVRAQLAKE